MMLGNNKKIKITIYSLVFLAVFVSTTNITKALAIRNELVGKPIGQVTHNGLSVSVNQISVDKLKETTEIVACINLPDNSDWLPYATIYDGLEAIQNEQLKLVNYKDPETSESSYRCYHFIFPKAVTSKSVRFTIEKLQTTIPEIITQEMCASAQDKIRKEYPNFVYSCEIGNHGLGYKIVEIPKYMTETQASGLINDALTDTVNGPWEIDVTVP